MELTLEGILNLVASSHLIVITHTEQVAQIRDRAVYAVRDVVLIPLTSQFDAEHVIEETVASRKHASKPSGDPDTDLSDAEEDAEPSGVEGEELPPEASAVEPPGNIEEDAEPSNIAFDEKSAETSAVEPSQGVLGKTSSLAKNVVQQPSRYGRFARGWFGKSGPNANARSKQEGNKNDDSTVNSSKQDGNELPNNEKTLFAGFQENADKEDSNEENAGKTLENDAPKASVKEASAIETLSGRIQRTTRLYFTSSGFYFSYDQDFSASLGGNETAEPDVPLWKQFDPLVSTSLIHVVEFANGRSTSGITI